MAWYSLNEVYYHHNNKSIAVVDDEEDIVTLFTEVLRENGHKVKGFTNPIFILDYVHQHPDEFRLIIVDYRMSPMQGSELASKISAINPKIKMILITAYDDIPNNDLNLEIVKKAITTSKLLKIIQQHMKCYTYSIILNITKCVFAD